MACRTLIGAVAALLLAGAAGCGGRSASLALTVSPRSATFDVPFTITVAGLKSRQKATITFAGSSSDGLKWQGHQTARANARGVLSLPDDYLIARMHAQGVHGVTYDFPDRLKIRVSAAGARATATADRHSFSPDSFSSSFEYPTGVGFYAAWDRPPGVRRHTAILLFGGSEGGLSNSALADALVAHGYPVLQLAYFGEPGLPSTLTRIPLEYFEHALRWLARRPQVDPKRIVTFGISRGGELSLILAGTFPQLVHAAVGYVPYFVAVGSPSRRGQPAWTFHGKPVLGEIIPVWKSSGPIFVAGGEADALWGSGAAVLEIAAEMRRHGRHDFTALDYPDAGHELGTVLPVQVPLSPSNYGIVSSPYGPLDLGGAPRPDEQAREDAWPKLLRFLAKIGG